MGRQKKGLENGKQKKNYDNKTEATSDGGKIGVERTEMV